MLGLPGRKLFVTDQGCGDAVIMLHGLGGTTSMYQPQGMTLAATHRVVRIDFAGAGRSPYRGPLSIESWADDVLGVLDALRIESACFVVHSLATLVVAEVISRNANYVRALVALGPVRSQPDTAKAATLKRAQTVRDGGMEKVVDGVVDMAVSEFAKRKKPLVGALVRESVLGQNPAGYAASCVALAAADEPRWSDVVMPTWLVGGSDDRLAPPDLIDTIADQIPNARREGAPGAGHWLSLEEPDYVTEIVQRALA